MAAIFHDALMDSLKMAPFLFIAYFLIELIEYRYGTMMREKLVHANKYGPLIGSVFGCVPQCGFSVMGTALYTRRLITIGTLLAIYLSTSDEAIPIILTQPSKIYWILPLLLTKVAIALIAGILIDIVFRKQKKVLVANLRNEDSVEGCCGHHVSPKIKKKELIIHPLKHTLTVFVFLFATTLLINMIISHIGEENLGRVLLKDTFFQPVIVALVGLIPNCAASVAITQVFLKGGIGYGSLIAGLCASGGLGLLVLLKEDKSRSDILRILFLLFFISVFAGLFIQYVLGIS